MPLIPIDLFCVFVFLHWFTDFVMQPGDWAVRKSKDLDALLSHTLLYTFSFGAGYCISFFLIPSLPQIDMLIFLSVTFVCHTITDFFTSRWSSKQYLEKNFGGAIPRGMDFFVTLGFDQMLHMLQLFITYILLK